MKTSELIELLQTQLMLCGDLPVFLNSGNDDDMYEVVAADLHNTEKGEFPRSWKMPENFIKIMA